MTDNARLARAIIATVKLHLSSQPRLATRVDSTREAARDALYNAGQVDRGSAKEEAQDVANEFRLGDLFGSNDVEAAVNTG